MVQLYAISLFFKDIIETKPLVSAYDLRTVPFFQRESAKEFIV